MGYAFNGTNPDVKWAINQLNRNVNIVDKALNGINSWLGNISQGSGAVVNAAAVEMAVQWAVNKATNNYITYSQTNRNLKNPSGTSFDCSSFIITAFSYAHIDVDANSTHDMVAGFTAVGFKWIEGSYWDANQLLRGDILLNITNHTQMYIGNNQDVNCGHTPASVCPHSTNNYGRGWDGILRYEG